MDYHPGLRKPWTLDRDVLWPTVRRFVRSEDVALVEKVIVSAERPQQVVFALHQMLCNAWNGASAVAKE